MTSSVHLYDVVDPDELRTMLDDGFVREQSHPAYPHLRILNYAEKAQYSRTWNPTTLACRGLIYDATDGTVLARPWAKFFNLGEHPEGALDLDAPVEVTDKADGSLGILYWTVETGWAIATRGSFASEQAEHATELYRRQYEGRWTPDPALTYLFEIIYPANRIVLDYGGLDDLLLLGAVEKADGSTFGPLALPECPLPGTFVMEYRTLASALAAPPRANAEGLVVRYLYDDTLVKLKQEDYVALHRIVTGLSERTVWEHLGAGKPLAELIEPLPDEFHDWVRDVAERLKAKSDQIWFDALVAFRRLVDGGPDRKTFAERAAQSPHRPLLFMLLDGKDIRPAIWKTLKPAAGTYARPTPQEDAA